MFDKSLLEMDMPWIESPFFEQLLAQKSLNAEDEQFVRYYAEHGYVIFEPKIPNFNQLADQIISDVKDKFTDPKRLQDAYSFSEAAKSLAGTQDILDKLRLLYQRNPFPFQTLNFRVGTEQPTHSDTVHFHSVPFRFMCGVWVALEDIDNFNGPLHYFPGSHKLPLYDYNDLGLMSSGDYSQYCVYETFIKKLMETSGCKRTELNVKKGQALIWAANLFHGGSPILDFNRTRHSQVTHYYFEDCLYYTPLLSDVFLGNIAWRKEIRNIVTGQIVPQKYKNKII